MNIYIPGMILGLGGATVAAVWLGERKIKEASQIFSACIVIGIIFTGGIIYSAAKVYFTRTIDAAHLIKLYKLINENIYGKVGIKLHTGEKHGPNILPRDMVKEFQAQVHLLDLNDLPEDDDDDRWPEGEILMEHMADSAKATCDHFGKHIIFINIMRRMSVDCDCAGVEAEEPTIADIGICASTDILAVDQACVDMVYSAPDGKDLIERIESRQGLRQLSALRELKMGNPQYELIEID